jgi:flagellar biogenesis protein FliO
MGNVYVELIRVILVLTAIIAGIFVLYRYKDKIKLNLRPRETPYGLKKVDMIHLGYKKFVSVVEVKGHVLVIGIGEKDLSLLAQWTKEDKEI